MRIKIILTIILQFILCSISNAQTSVTVSGIIKDKNTKIVLPFVNVVLKTEKDSTFVSGTVTNEEGRFSLSKIKSGSYYLEVSYISYTTKKQSLFVGTLTEYLDIKTIEIEEKSTSLNEIIITAKTTEISEKMDKNLVHQDVLRLQVAMDDAVPVRVAERARNGRRDVDGFVHGQLFLALEPRAQ